MQRAIILPTGEREPGNFTTVPAGLSRPDHTAAGVLTAPGGGITLKENCFARKITTRERGTAAIQSIPARVR